MATHCEECGKKLPVQGGYEPLVGTSLGDDVRFCSREHRTAYQQRRLRESEQTGGDELDEGQIPLGMRGVRGERSPVGGDAGSGKDGVSEGKGTIARLADFYSGLTVFVFWLFICGCVVGLLGWIIADGSAALTFASVLGLSIVGVIATGATAVLLDIMRNIREINRN